MPAKDVNFFRPALTYMRRHFKNKIVLADMARRMHMGKDHFQHEFTRTFGYSPQKAIEAMRVEKAKKLIRQGQPMLEVARLAGFKNSTYLSERFKMATGLQPREYRKACQEGRL